LFIAIITVSWQSWRSATMNPVEALRYEWTKLSHKFANVTLTGAISIFVTITCWLLYYYTTSWFNLANPTNLY
jgi:hypothetical protein